MSLSEFQFMVLLSVFLLSIISFFTEEKLISIIGIALFASFSIPTFKAYNDPILIELLDEAKTSARAKNITFFNQMPTDEKQKLDAYTAEQGLFCQTLQTTEGLYICFKKIF